MSGPKRNPDKLNTIGVVVVGICGAVMVYVTIVALQAFYMNDTSEIQTMADYGGQDTAAKSHKSDEMHNITEAASNGAAPGTPQTYRIHIDRAMELVARDATGTPDHPGTPDHLVPGLDRGPTDKVTATVPTVKPIFGRPQAIETPAPAPPTGGAGSGAPPAGAGSAAPPAGAGSAAPMMGSGAGAPPPAKADEKKADKKTEKKADEKKAEPKAEKKADDKKAPAAGSAAAPAGGHAP